MWFIRRHKPDSQHRHSSLLSQRRMWYLCPSHRPWPLLSASRQLLWIKKKKKCNEARGIRSTVRSGYVPVEVSDGGGKLARRVRCNRSRCVDCVRDILGTTGAGSAWALHIAAHWGASYAKGRYNNGVCVCLAQEGEDNGGGGKELGEHLAYN
jgi:hypothetical protein